LSSTPERHKAAASAQRSSPVDVMVQGNSLVLNISKTKELIVDFRNHRGPHSPIILDRTPGKSSAASVSWDYRSLKT